MIMERPARDFKGVWIPREIWLSPTLSLMEKVLFVEIHSLDNERGCYASNRYFADFFGLSPRQIGTHIASLKEKGFVTVDIQNQNERTIRVCGKYARVREPELRRLREEKAALIHRMDARQSQGV
jgi:DNA-binding transcriptional ArsR family regulator